MQRLASLLKNGRLLAPPSQPAVYPAHPGASFRDMDPPQADTAVNPVHMGRLHLCGQACRFSPYRDDLLAVATSQLFGMVGPGALEILALKKKPDSLHVASSHDPTTFPVASPADVHADPAAVIHPVRVALLNHKQSVNDVAWSELSARTLVSGGGGGVISVWGLSGQSAAEPGSCAGRDFGGVCVRELKGHSRDVVSLSWSCVDKRFLTSSALDGKLRIWDMQQFAAVQAFQHSPTEASCSCSTSPVEAALVASVGADGRLAIHDMRSSSAGDRPAGPAWDVTAHPCEVLCVDWVKHRPWQILTGAADGTVAFWDLRKSVGGASGSSNETSLAATCRISSTQAHQLAVRRVASHPFKAERFATCSYDMQVKIWDSDEATSIFTATTPDEPPRATARVPSPFSGGSGWVRLQACFDHHREFILGLDWSTFTCGMLASTSWDRSICVWNADTGPAPLLVPKRPLFLGMKAPK